MSLAIDLNGEYNVSIRNKKNFGNITIPLFIKILLNTNSIINNIIINMMIKIISLPSNEYINSKSNVMLKPFNSVFIMFSVQ